MSKSNKQAVEGRGIGSALDFINNLDSKVAREFTRESKAKAKSFENAVKVVDLDADWLEPAKVDSINRRVAMFTKKVEKNVYREQRLNAIKDGYSVEALDDLKREYLSLVKPDANGISSLHGKISSIISARDKKLAKMNNKQAKKNVRSYYDCELIYWKSFSATEKMLESFGLIKTSENFQVIESTLIKED